ncbi:hypothetical protein P3T76_008065 [Phytophthora citrophthora]|uniref:Uncharacterized protein n=1 Tax=Phytophthora citrophthora TaxID=4793 RepID=A0AAD9LMU6_9STRA|nr:hypothetical protein P3T76_008065 [Phytophthora citrophthora]
MGLGPGPGHSYLPVMNVLVATVVVEVAGVDAVVEVVVGSVETEASTGLSKISRRFLKSKHFKSAL